jgi:hypothetical protein
MTGKLLLVSLITLLVCAGFGFEASCTGPPEEWRLTIGSTEGGTVIGPGEGMFWYAPGEAVNLWALPAPGYRFVNWTGKVGTIENINERVTTITMELDYTIAANFAPRETGE